MPVQRQESASIQEVLDGIAVAHAEARLREAEAKAAEAANRTRHQYDVGREEVRKAKERGDRAAAEARTARQDNWRRWASFVVAMIFVAVLAARGAPGSLPSAEQGATSLVTASLTPAPSPDQDAAGDEPMTGRENELVEHLSSSKFQGEVEQLMVKILGKELGVDLAERSIGYHGAVMKIDGLDDEETVFVEAFAHVGAFKSGQRRKVATDVLKFVALRADHPDAKFVLAFVDPTALASVTGWVKAVAEQHGIKLVLVDVPAAAIKKLTLTQLDQKAGMETGGDQTSPAG